MITNSSISRINDSAILIVTYAIDQSQSQPTFITFTLKTALLTTWNILITRLTIFCFLALHTYKGKNQFDKQSSHWHYYIEDSQVLNNCKQYIRISLNPIYNHNIFHTDFRDLQMGKILDIQDLEDKLNSICQHIENHFHHLTSNQYRFAVH